MIELIALALAALAGLWDLRTTEVPDDIPYLMTVLGLTYWFVIGTSTGNMQPFLTALIVGSVALVAGLALYAKGKWGGADAWMLAAILYMVPLVGSELTLISYVMNFFIVSLVYLVAYTIVLGARHHIFGRVASELRKQALTVFAVPAVYGLLILFFSVLMRTTIAVHLFVLSFALFLFLAVFWVYSRVIERTIFVRTIPVTKLKPGDVLKETRWVGVTEAEIEALKRTKRTVTIKDGVRFVPVFAITLAVTLIYGNVLLMVL